MAQNFVVGGVTYPFPDPGDEDWGQQVVDWATAVTNALGASTVFVPDRASDPTLGDGKQIYWNLSEGVLKFFDGTTAYGVTLVP